MLSYQNIKTVARYEKKTLLRSWFFKIFALLAIIGISFFHIGTTADTGISAWAFRAIPGNIPYSNIKFLNIIQSIIAVFLASGFLKRDKKYDTSVVIYVRPMSNTEYILGKTFGIFKVFMGLNFISLFIAFIINSIGADTPLNVLSYLIYPLIISVPSIIFILGLSFVVMVVIRNQAITFLILLGYIGLCVFYFGAKFHGLMDYTSYHLPLIQSDIIGFGNLGEIISHRAAYLMLGLAFIFFTIVRINRLPHSPKKIKRYWALALIFLISGAFLIANLAIYNSNESGKRKEYIALDKQYYNTPTLNVTDINIELEHKGKTIKSDVALKLINNTDKDLSSFILSLNPGLKIESLKAKGLSLKHERKNHIIIISSDRPIKTGENISMNISYSGDIDESVCFRDINEEVYEEPYSIWGFNIDKRYSFLNDDFVLLCPEALWYPVSGLKYNGDKPVFGKYQFANYSLKVKTKPNLTAISQGKCINNNTGEYIFKPELPMPQISLAISEFEKKSITVDSVEISLLYAKGHDYFSPVFEEIQDTIPSLIREFKNQFELEKKRNYPFNRLTLVEVPVQFKTYKRLWTQTRETVQPEMVLLPESGIDLPDGDFNASLSRMKRWRRDQNVKEKKLKINLFNKCINDIFKRSGSQHTSMSREIRRNAGVRVSFNATSSNERIYSLDPYFYNFTNNIRSDKYPIVNSLFETILTKEEISMRQMFRANFGGMTDQDISNIYLKDKSLNNVLSSIDIKTDKLSAIIKNKADYLQAIFTSKIDAEEFKAFMSSFLEENKFKNINFDYLVESFDKKYNTNIKNDIHQWYYANKSPGYIISDILTTQIVDNDQKKYQLYFTISNPEPQAGIIKVSLMEGNMGMGRRMFRNSVSNAKEYYYYIDGSSNKEIGIVCSGKPMMATINTLCSQNLPASMTNRFEKFDDSPKGPFHGIRDINVYKKEEIIVDNENEGFSLEEHSKDLKIKSLFKNKKETTPDEKYKWVNIWMPPEKWTLTTKTGNYGKYIKSSYYIKGGDGQQKAIWTAGIKKSGYYDIYFYRQERSTFMSFGRRRSRNNKMPDNKYNITVHSDDGEDSMEVDMNRQQGNWVHLGSYYLSAGDTKVVLSNKSESIVFADAVKWVIKQ